MDKKSLKIKVLTSLLEKYSGEKVVLKEEDNDGTGIVSNLVSELNNVTTRWASKLEPVDIIKALKIVTHSWEQEL